MSLLKGPNWQNYSCSVLTKSGTSFFVFFFYTQKSPPDTYIFLSLKKKFNYTGNLEIKASRTPIQIII